VRPRPDQGFTLIEVLVAMIILSIGLMGLEALAIGAARSNAFADRQSRFTVDVSAELEQSIRVLRGANPTTLQAACIELPGQDTLSRAVDWSNARLPTVTVTYRPNRTRKPVPPTVSVSGSVYVPAGTAGTTGGGCA
jgi:prepilin-type N-terminal cleavage/methylation domain-containing protein